MKLCLFSSYYDKPFVPNYVKFYLEELSKRYDVILITNEREINVYNRDFLTRIGVKLMMVDNQGYDFGMWYKALQDTDASKYDELALVNDSCILFKPLNEFFESCDSSEAQYYGMLNSNELGQHIQSYFLVIKNDAIQHVVDYFNETGIIEGDVSKTIDNYEIGICEYLRGKNVNIDSYLNCDNYAKHDLNVMMLHTMELISDGLPIIKKKILFDTFRDHERSYLHHHNYNFTFDYASSLEDIMYQNNDNININYLLDI